jgi:hypothetical protein
MSIKSLRSRSVTSVNHNSVPKYEGSTFKEKELSELAQS